MNTNDSEALLDAIRRSSTRIFLAGIDTDRHGRETLTLHAAKSVAGRKEIAELRDEIVAAGYVHGVKTRLHSDRKLIRARSMEKFLRPMAHGEILLDATGAFERGAQLVGFADAMRNLLGDKLGGVYWNARWRTVHVLLQHKHFVHGETMRVNELAEVEGKARKALALSMDEAFCPAIRLGFELPEADLVPVDRKSAPARSLAFPAIGRYMRVPAIGMAIGLGTVTGAAAEGPAVSALNGKIAVIGGYTDDDTRSGEYQGILAGSLTMPVGHSFGFQADAAIGSNDGDPIAGVGGHLFWRDPSQALVGVIASYAREDQRGGNPDLESTRLGGETEIYLGQFTLAARAGHQFGHNVDDGFFGRADVSWYATDDFRLRLGVANDPIIDTSVSGDVEFRPGYEAIPGLAYFADTSFGDDSYARASIGVRFYFGDPAKSLKQRHREDDPEDNLGLEGLNSVTASPQGNNYTAYIGPV